MAHAPVTVDIEVALRPSSVVRPSDVRERMCQLIERSAAAFVPGPITLPLDDEFLAAHVASARVCELREWWRRVCLPRLTGCGACHSGARVLLLLPSFGCYPPPHPPTPLFTAADELAPLPFWRGAVNVVVYQNCLDGPSSESAAEDGEGGGGEAISNYSQHELPNAAFEGLWESLVYDVTIKGRCVPARPPPPACDMCICSGVGMGGGC